MAVISISEAARTWHIARSTLQRTLQEEGLSATVKADGSKGIDATELISERLDGVWFSGKS